MSKNKWASQEPTDQEIEEMITPASPEPLNKDLLREVFLGLMKLPRHGNDHWMTVMGLAVEITRHMQKL